jgi:hypothetical protein
MAKDIRAIQAISETGGTAKMLVFGQVHEYLVIPIDEACAACKVWKETYPTIQPCRVFHDREAKKRGFTHVSCPHQFRRP